MNDNFISLNIRYLLSKENLPKDTFGKKFGLNRGAIASYIDGKSKPKIETLQKISKYFNLFIDDIVNKDLSNYNSITNNGDTKLSEKEALSVIESLYKHESQLIKYELFNTWVKKIEVEAKNKILKELLIDRMSSKEKI